MLHRKGYYFRGGKWAIPRVTLFIGALVVTALTLNFRIDAQVHVRGVVTDINRTTLPGATVCTYPDTICGTTDANGVFEIRRRSWPQRLEVTYIGYEKYVMEVSEFDESVHYHIAIREKSTQMDEVLIQEDRISRGVFQPKTVIGDDFFEDQASGNFSAALSRLPGVSHLGVGVGVGKPVIRGLYSNRVVVSDMGVKQESHQWGTDHGLAINQFRPGKVEVIKGPGSLRYGSDGLGGVVRIRPDPIPQKGFLEGALMGLGKSNNDHIGYAIHLAGSGKKWFGSANYSGQSFADTRVPADTFVYNSFVLPLFNERLKNTAGREKTGSGTIGYRNNGTIFRLTYSSYYQESGLFSGAVGIPRAFALQDDGDDRNIEFPSSEVHHQKLIFKYQRSMDEKRRIELTAGIQNNLRREFSFPEFHAVEERDPNLRKAIELQLRTYSFDGTFSREDVFSIGGSFQFQNNEIGGFDYFLPPFEVIRAGIFGTRNFEFSEDFNLEAGIRLDFGHNRSRADGRFVWDTNGNIIDSLVSPDLSNSYFNFATSLGAVKKINRWEGEAELFGSLGKSFRIPYPVETSSDGVHHGTFRHEKGRSDLRSEHGIQFDFGFRYNETDRYFSISPFFNFFHNYIYLRPSNTFSTLPDAGQLYTYEQHDVFYTGLEIEWTYVLVERIRFFQAAEMIWNYNIETRLPLPFTPPHSILTEVGFEKLSPWPWLDAEIQLTHHYHFAQNRVDRNEDATPAYHLFNIGMKWSFPKMLNGINIRFQVKNLLDNTHFKHLSRYRPLNIPEQGRNFVVQLKIPIRVKVF